MTEQEQLLAGVIANPDDDAPRLIYADWLEENGHAEQAEFIRVQIRLSDLGFADPHNDQINQMDEVGSLAWRQRKLWAKMPFVKHSGLSTNVYLSIGRKVHESYIDPGKLSGLVRRGFIDEVRCSTSDYMQHCHAIAAKHPVRKWVLTDFKPWENTTHLGDLNFSVWNESMLIAKSGPSDGEIPCELFLFFKAVSRGRLSEDGKSFCDYEEDEAKLLAEDLEQATYNYARSKLPYLQHAFANP